MHELIYLKRVPSESIGVGSSIRPLSTTSMVRSANSGLGSGASSIGTGGATTTFVPFLAPPHPHPFFFAASASAILAANPNSQSGVYWIKIPGGVGAKEVYCDMTNGGWMLVMRGLGEENIPYGDARWTDSDEIDAHNLLTPEFGTFAKSAAFASYDSATWVLLVAGGFSGANAGGKFRSFEFDFDSPANKT
jgi:hypothetical protein